jgi:ligand-binding SRPBCC domain-containing protein
LRTYRHAFTVNAALSSVWEFYTDVKHLELITPPELDLRLVRATHQQLEEGTEVWITGKLLTRSSWHSKITSLRPYEYVDEMISGRFRVWKHKHAFRATPTGGTEVIDEVDFELPYGAIGRFFDGYVLRKLGMVFAYREKATKARLERAV